MKKTAFYLIALLTLLGVIAPSVSYAMTREEILAQIQILLAQVRYLQEEINKLQGGGSTTCNYFVRDLQYSNAGADVAALHTILQREGFTVPSSETSSQYFGFGTVSAVVNFQNKYALEAYGSGGVGYVGGATKTKLNQLYCGNTNYGGSVVRIVSPNGGEQYNAGQSVQVSWTYSDTYSYKTFNVELWKGSQLIQTTSATGATYAYVYLPSSIYTGSDYKFKVIETNNTSNYDWSDQNFSINSNYSNSNQSILLQANPTSGTRPLSVTFTANLYNFPSCGNLPYVWNFSDTGIENVYISGCYGNTTTLPVQTISKTHTFQNAGSQSASVSASGINSNMVSIYVY